MELHNNFVEFSCLFPYNFVLAYEALEAIPSRSATPLSLSRCARSKPLSLDDLEITALWSPVSQRGDRLGVRAPLGPSLRTLRSADPTG